MPEHKTIGQLMEEMRLKAGAQNYHGHGYMDLERFAEDTRHMIIFDVLSNDSPVGWKGERTRLFLTDNGYQKSLESQEKGHIKILSHAAKGVIQTYGLDRVMLVLANTVQLQDWDGRYSHRNKEWAKTIPNYNSDTVRRGYALNSHPAVLDGFIDLVREEQQRSHTKGEKAQQPRTSVRDKLKQEPPAHKPVTQKKREQER